MSDMPNAAEQGPLQAPGSPVSASASSGDPSSDPPAYVPPQPIGPPPPHWSAPLTAHKPGIVPLAPLGFGDFIEGGFRAIRRNPGTMVGLTLLTALLVGGLAAALVALAYLVGTQLSSTGPPDGVLVAGGFGGAALLYLGILITSAALTGVLAYPVGEAVLGRKPTLGETWSRTRRMIPRLVGLCLAMVLPVVLTLGALVGLAIWAFSSDTAGVGLLAIVAIIVGGVAAAWASVRLSFAAPALVLEDLGVVSAIRRSWKLTFGRFWRIVGVRTVAGLIAGVAQQAISIGVRLLGTALGLGVVSTTTGPASRATVTIVTLGMTLAASLIAGLLTQPFMAAVATLLYTDARIRGEGFDLTLLRAAAGAQQARVATG